MALKQGLKKLNLEFDQELIDKLSLSPQTPIKQPKKLYLFLPEYAIAASFGDERTNFFIEDDSTRQRVANEKACILIYLEIYKWLKKLAKVKNVELEELNQDISLDDIPADLLEMFPRCIFSFYNITREISFIEFEKLLCEAGMISYRNLTQKKYVVARKLSKIIAAETSLFDNENLEAQIPKEISKIVDPELFKKTQMYTAKILLSGESDYLTDEFTGYLKYIFNLCEAARISTKEIFSIANSVFEIIETLEQIEAINPEVKREVSKLSIVEPQINFLRKTLETYYGRLYSKASKYYAPEEVEPSKLLKVKPEDVEPIDKSKHIIVSEEGEKIKEMTTAKLNKEEQLQKLLEQAKHKVENEEQDDDEFLANLFQDSKAQN